MERIAVRFKNGQVNPGEAGIIAGAPDDVLDVEGATVLEERLAVADVHNARNALDSGGDEVSRFHANQRRGPVKHFGPEFATNRCGERKNVMADEAHDANGHKASEEAFNWEGNVAGFLARHDCGMSAGKFDGDIGGGVAG